MAEKHTPKCIDDITWISCSLSKMFGSIYIWLGNVAVLKFAVARNCFFFIFLYCRIFVLILIIHSYTTLYIGLHHNTKHIPKSYP
jgi:hypothetical protein